MSVDNSELMAFQNQIQALKDDIPEIMDSLAVGEGRYARDQARKICKEENIVNTGDYRRNFKSGTKSRERSGHRLGPVSKTARKKSTIARSLVTGKWTVSKARRKQRKPFWF